MELACSITPTLVSDLSPTRLGLKPTSKVISFIILVTVFTPSWFWIPLHVIENYLYFTFKTRKKSETFQCAIQIAIIFTMPSSFESPITKKKGGILSRVWTLNTRGTNLMYIIEVLLRLKELLQVLLLQQNPYIHLNVIVLFLWTTRDQFLSQFLF